MLTVRKLGERLGAVQHKANFDYDLPLRRLMHRTTVRGSVPVGG